MEREDFVAEAEAAVPAPARVSVRERPPLVSEVHIACLSLLWDFILMFDLFILFGSM